MRQLSYEFLISIFFLCSCTWNNVVIALCSPDCSTCDEVNAQDLRLNHINVVTKKENVACIKGTFSLAFKIEAESESESSLLGYLEMEDMSATLGSCEIISQLKPSCIKQLDSQQSQSDCNQSYADRSMYQIQVQAIFPCGRVNFTFVKDMKLSSYYVSSITGEIELQDTESSLIATKFSTPKNNVYFKTSDLHHHYKQIEQLVQVDFKPNVDSLIKISAHFYEVEIETFATSTSLEFDTESDPNSKAIDTLSSDNNSVS